MNRRAELRKLKIFLLKQKDWIEDCLVYFNGIKTMMVAPNDCLFIRQLKTCYPLFPEDVDVLIKKKDLYVTATKIEFLQNLVDIPLKFYKNKVEIIIPEKYSPLLITSKNSNFTWAIAPLVDDDGEFNTIKGFVELSGCKCPNIYNRKFNGDLL